jgi:hypothetical protein
MVRDAGRHNDTLADLYLDHVRRRLLARRLAVAEARRLARRPTSTLPGRYGTGVQIGNNSG